VQYFSSEKKTPTKFIQYSSARPKITAKVALIAKMAVHIQIFVRDNWLTWKLNYNLLTIPVKRLREFSIFNEVFFNTKWRYDFFTVLYRGDWR
jgi:hypothetical protein